MKNFKPKNKVKTCEGSSGKASGTERVAQKAGNPDESRKTLFHDKSSDPGEKIIN